MAHRKNVHVTNRNSTVSTKCDTKSSKLIVFDWDDTLFPTTEIQEIFKGIDELTPFQHQNLTKLSQLIYNTLIIYIKQYKSNNIRIVTASENGWIEQSLLNMNNIGNFRDIYNLIFIQHDIKMYHPEQYVLPFKTSQDLYVWKYSIFSKLFKEFYIKNINTINTFVSIGDSFVEFKASKAAANLYQKASNICIHRLKLIKFPSFVDMIEQINLVSTFCGVFENESLKKKGITIDYD